jgi:SAM-dependent methyltransferase
MITHGASGINNVGHRRYVGGKWELIGRMQAAFLVGAGMQPSDVVVDIGCGALRGGIHIMKHLHPGHYIGVEQHKALIERGIDKELGRRTYEELRPQLIIDEHFRFQKMEKTPTIAWAQSVLTHLPVPLVEKCLCRLRPHISETGVFYATVWLTEDDPNRPDQQHDHKAFPYRTEELRAIAKWAGWGFQFIGSWAHPRGQKMVKFTPGEHGNPDS